VFVNLNAWCLFCLGISTHALIVRVKIKYLFQTNMDTKASWLPFTQQTVYTAYHVSFQDRVAYVTNNTPQSFCLVTVLPYTVLLRDAVARVQQRAMHPKLRSRTDAPSKSGKVLAFRETKIMSFWNGLSSLNYRCLRFNLEEWNNNNNNNNNRVR